MYESRISAVQPVALHFNVHLISKSAGFTSLLATITLCSCYGCCQSTIFGIAVMRTVPITTWWTSFSCWDYSSTFSHSDSYLLAILGVRGERGSEEKMERLGLLVLPPPVHSCPLPCPSILRGLVMRPPATPGEAEARGRGSTMRISWEGAPTTPSHESEATRGRAAGNGMRTWLGKDRRARHRSHEADSYSKWNTFSLRFYRKNDHFYHAAMWSL